MRPLERLGLDARMNPMQAALADLRSAEAAIETQRQFHGEQTEVVSQIQGRYYAVGADISRVEEAIQFGQKRVRQLELDLGTLEERATENARQLAADEAEIVALETQIARLAPDVEALAAADQSSAERLVELESGYRDWQRRWDQVSAESARHEREAEVQAQRVVYLGQQLERRIGDRRVQDGLVHLGVRHGRLAAHRAGNRCCRRGCAKAERGCRHGRRHSRCCGGRRGIEAHSTDRCGDAGEGIKVSHATATAETSTDCASAICCNTVYTAL